LVLFGLGMSFWRLTVPSWHADELAYASAGDAYWAGDFQVNDEHPPLGKELIGAARLLFGHTLWATRFPAALGLFLGGLLLWVWLSRVAPPPAGPLAAALWWSLPSLVAFPEALGDGPGTMTALPMRYGLLDPLAAVLALAAVVAGWWWIQSGWGRAAAVCGLASGLAVATKLPAVLVVAVPAVAGCASLALRAGVSLGTRLRRLAAQAGLWAAAAAGAFMLAYLPAGRDAPRIFAAGWRHQHEHGGSGHAVVVAGTFTTHPPWWTLGWWQYMAWGATAVAVLIVCTLPALQSRPLLVGYLTAAWAVPAALLIPIAHLALPHYILLWRPTIVAAVAVTLAVAAAWVRQHAVPAAAAAFVVLALAGLAVPAGRTVYATARLSPQDYAKLPTLVPAGRVWLIGHCRLTETYLPGRSIADAPETLSRAMTLPTALVLDRSMTIRFGARGLPEWMHQHGYHLIRAGILDVWLSPAPTGPAGGHNASRAPTHPSAHPKAGNPPSCTT